MNCPYCKKEIEAMTGLQEAVKFQKHLIKCKKNPKRRVVLGNDEWNKGREINLTCSSLEEALNIRAESGQ